jgi:hypothetical protein
MLQRGEGEFVTTLACEVKDLFTFLPTRTTPNPYESGPF